MNAEQKISSNAALLKWFEVQDIDIQRVFSARCALRVLPAGMELLAVPEIPNGHEIVLGFFRTTLNAAVGAKYNAHIEKQLPRHLFTAASVQISQADTKLIERHHPGAFNAASAANDSNSSFDDPFGLHPIGSLLKASHEVIKYLRPNIEKPQEYAFADASYISEMGVETALDTPIWLGGDLAGPLSKEWDRFVEETSRTAHWDFWKRWYQGILQGKPLDWNLQRHVALDVGSDVWDAGIEAVAKRVAEIEEKWRYANSDSHEISPEPVSKNSVAALFDRSPVVIASMKTLSETVSLRVDAFDRMARPNEYVPFLETYRRLPQTADRITKVLENGPDAKNSETLLALEVGQLRAEIEALRLQLKDAYDDLAELRKKPWYKSSSILCTFAVATGLWALSGDEKSLEQRWIKISADFEFLNSGIWPNGLERIDEPLRLELPETQDV